jgi:biotin carboxyl carrier protein
MAGTTTYQVAIGERVLRIELRRLEDDGWTVRVEDGEERPVEMGVVHAALHWLQQENRRVEFLARASGEDVTLTIAGLEYSAQVVDEARARLASVAGGRAGGHARRELKAPMPGLLVRLLSQPGDVVEAGQPLAVLQAMKMENELSLPRGGTVVSVHAEAGKTVEQGQVLVVIE